MDSDVQCVTPFRRILHPADSFVAGVESDVDLESDPTLAALTSHRQLLQWAIASAPGHPVLRHLLDAIATRVRAGGATFAPDSLYEVLETTGPGAFSRCVRWATVQQAAEWLAV